MRSANNCSGIVLILAAAAGIATFDAAHAATKNARRKSRMRRIRQVRKTERNRLRPARPIPAFTSKARVRTNGAVLSQRE